jgi:FRG domain
MVFPRPEKGVGGLEPRIERECSLMLLKETERQMLGDFRSKAHLYTAHTPQPEDSAGWLAMMQHHGVPTRLLDWTYSAYVALFFAVEVEGDEADDAALWGIHIDALEGTSRRRAARILDVPGDAVLGAPIHFNTLAFGPYFVPGTNTGLAVPILPQFQVSRLSSQQGCFLFNCNAFMRFEDSLLEMMTGMPSRWLVRIRFPRQLRDEVLRRLMHFNVHPATLFPDLDGLAGFIRLKNTLFPYPHKPGDVLIDAPTQCGDT